jgi:hypothetical protein
MDIYLSMLVRGGLDMVVGKQTRLACVGKGF